MGIKVFRGKNLIYMQVILKEATSVTIIIFDTEIIIIDTE
jgi:hypothetical protein